jgi:hypothetical protein
LISKVDVTIVVKVAMNMTVSFVPGCTVPDIRMHVVLMAVRVIKHAANRGDQPEGEHDNVGDDKRYVRSAQKKIDHSTLTDNHAQQADRVARLV